MSSGDAFINTGFQAGDMRELGESRLNGFYVARRRTGLKADVNERRTSNVQYPTLNLSEFDVGR